MREIRLSGLMRGGEEEPKLATTACLIWYAFLSAYSTSCKSFFKLSPPILHSSSQLRLVESVAELWLSPPKPLTQWPYRQIVNKSG
jgi:hypothetical protein